VRQYHKIVSLTFLLFIGAVALAGFIAKDRDFSPNENRYLADAPVFRISDVMSGEFQDDLEDYLNDQIWGRDWWITVKTAVQKLCGDTDIGGAYLGKDGYDFEKILPEDVDDTLVERNIAQVSTYFDFCAQTIEPSRISFLLVPTSGLVLKDKLPDNAILFDQQQYLDRIMDSFSDYNVVDVTETLATHASEGVYYHTDHHWTTLGALYAYEAWCGATGETFGGVEDYTQTQVTDKFRGSLYSKVLDADSVYDKVYRMDKKTGQDSGQTSVTVTADGEQLDGFYDADKLLEKDKYAYFFGGNYGEVVIDTGKNTSRRLLVIKDSFANCFVPFLAEDYDAIYMIDLRYYNQNMQEYITANGITDVLVLYNVSNFITDKNFIRLNAKR
jgi:hypothetical protein